MTEEKKNKIIGAATSGGVHLLILFVVFLLLASAPPIEKEEEPGGGGGGNPVGEGQGAAEGEAGGAIEPVEIAFAPMPETYVGADISAPTISESKTPVEHQPNKTNSDRTQTAQTQPKPSELDNLLDGLSGGGGSDASTGGGTGGKNGGDGGGDNGGNGPGSGKFTGPGFGNGTSWSLKGRGSLTGPSTSKKPTANGQVVVSITVDKNGKVTKATVAKSNITTDVAHNHELALEAARKCTFTSSSSSMPQNGTITIVLAVK